MRALELFAPRQLRLVEIPRRELQPFEIRVRVACTAVCGSDLIFWRDPAHVPQILGHELAGTVVEVGSGITFSLAPGDRVTASAIVSCLHCATCAAGRGRLCQDKRIVGFQIPGAFADEVVLDGRFAVSLRPELSFEQGALIEPLGCGLSLAKRILAALRKEREANILILGDGPIALADLQMLRVCGLRNISLIGKHRRRMELAAEFGAGVVLDAKNLPELREGLAVMPPPDVCVVAADADATLIQILPRLQPEALVFVQVRSASSGLLRWIVTPEIRVIGAFAYELNDLRETIDLVALQKIETGPWITDRIALSRAADEFPDLLDKAARMKTLIVPD